MKKLLIVVLMLTLAVSAACAAELDVKDYPVVDGSTATLPLSYALMSRFTGITEDEAKEYIRHSKTSESFYELVDGRADLLLVYEPNDEVFDYADEAGVKLEMKPIGRDALVFLINDGNTVDSMTHDEVVSVYSGKITNWSEVGGDDMPIVAYQRVEQSGSQVLMRKAVMKDVPMTEAPKTLKPSEMGELVDEIASYRNDKNAIGYSVYFYVNNMYMQDGIKLMAVTGVSPSNETITSGEYPYVQDFYAVIRANEPSDSTARMLYDWLGTDEGIELIEIAGYAAVK